MREPIKTKADRSFEFFENKLSPMGWVEALLSCSKGKKTKISAVLYVWARLALILALWICSYYSWHLPINIAILITVYDLIEVLTLVIAVYLLFDIIIVNTGSALNYKKPCRNILRSALLIYFSYFQIGMIYSIFYILFADHFETQIKIKTNILHSVYLSFINVWSSGTPVLSDHAPTAIPGYIIVITQVLLSFYFVSLVVATIINHQNPPRLSAKSQYDT